ncbi:hypothetical protein [Maribacter sp. R77961]|uniref:hypothetical protein n=1 Tax=Maribacter sp. R77961 TaxID=3093871 RepID=UPI0037C6DEB9
MATQICPKFKVDSFNWKVDEDESPLTIWDCGNCNYRAFENETDERNCSNCGKKTESKLKDNKKEYWWCSNCSTTKEIKKTMSARIKRDIEKHKENNKRIVELAKRDVKKYKKDLYGNKENDNGKDSE